MELDDLKEIWDCKSQLGFKINKRSFMESLHDKNYDPVAVLKNKFLRILIISPLIAGGIIYDFIKKPELLNNILMWFLVVIIVALTGFYWFNYTIVKKLQNINSSVKESIEKNISTLENGFKKYLFARRILYVFVVILFEVLMYLHKEPDYESWYSISVYIRIPIYILGFFITYFGKKVSYKKRIGQHVSYLRGLLNKMD